MGSYGHPGLVSECAICAGVMSEDERRMVSALQEWLVGILEVIR